MTLIRDYEIDESSVNEYEEASSNPSKRRFSVRKRRTTSLVRDRKMTNMDIEERNESLNEDNTSSQRDVNDRHNSDDCHHDDSVDEDFRPSEIPSKVNVGDLHRSKIDELVCIADKCGIEVTNNMTKCDILLSIMRTVSFAGGTIECSGIIEVLPEGFGFLRYSDYNYAASSDDMYVSASQVRRFGLKTGEFVRGEAREPRRGERYFALQKIYNENFEQVKGGHYHRSHFDDLTPLYPEERIVLENETLSSSDQDISSRVIDLVTPLGKGQRALIVAPPRTGKTMLLQNIAHSISVNNPEIELIVLLIDERPEEVTDMSRSVKGEVVSSTFDEPAVRHVQLAEIVIEKAKRLVEKKRDVVILLDSITRLARAYNTVVPSSGKVLTGGVDSNALQRPKRFFGAARNVEQGGSLTIIATALVDTGSRMDEVIFEEFKGTGNAEIVLDRKIADKRVFPAIDIAKSGTRKEELLMSKSALSKTWMLRRILTQMNSLEAMEFLGDKLKQSKNNSSFFDLMNN